MTQSALQIEVCIKDQELCLKQGADCIARYRVSTASNGAGEQMGSEKTPRGLHRIRAMIGQGEPRGAVFVGRRATGEVWSQGLNDAQPNRDWILTRILWLGGLEPHRNRYGEVDSQQRYIYIHGTPDSEPMGEPRSHGCIRMRNTDIAELFDLVAPNTLVEIYE